MCGAVRTSHILKYFLDTLSSRPRYKSLLGVPLVAPCDNGTSNPTGKNGTAPPMSSLISGTATLPVAYNILVVNRLPNLPNSGHPADYQPLFPSRSYPLLPKTHALEQAPTISLQHDIYSCLKGLLHPVFLLIGMSSHWGWSNPSKEPMQSCFYLTEQQGTPRSVLATT